MRELHRLAVCRLAEGLVRLDILKSPVNARVEDGSVEELFFMHGLGHLIGIHTHDVMNMKKKKGYLLPGRDPDLTQPGGRRCSADFILQPGMTLTDEPGIYFQPWVLNDPAMREKYRDAVNWDLIDQILKTGEAGYGVRIEDTLVVTESGEPINLSVDIPKEPDEVEALRPAA